MGTDLRQLLQFTYENGKEIIILEAHSESIRLWLQWIRIRSKNRSAVKIKTIELLKTGYSLVTFRENVVVKGSCQFLVNVSQTFYHNLGMLNPISLVPKRNFVFLSLLF